MQKSLSAAFLVCAGDHLFVCSRFCSASPPLATTCPLKSGTLVTSFGS
ncbi:MAG: hypothetical protein H6577_00175 [Lewinellaceae bacterium]|nr:hypothetical protein [Saprospiraceae bacterium]MCB9336525.1 hypothetical protein [Lewinellaceae bacterium]